MRVAAVQMNSGPRLDANLERCAKLLREAAARGAGLVVLPENFSLMPASEGNRIAAAEQDGAGPAQAFMSAQARQMGLWMVGGTLPIRARGGTKVRASSLVFDNRGRRVARYDKIHLFDVELGSDEAYCESDAIEPGPVNANLVCIDTPAGRLGLSVCYDLRFPELYRRLSGDGAELFAVPSAFTATTGQAHWEPLLRARAIENLAYVVAPGQCGRHASGRRTHGHSLIVDPWGRILGDCGGGEGVLTAEIDRELVASLRRGFPALQHRRI